MADESDEPKKPQTASSQQAISRLSLARTDPSLALQDPSVPKIYANGFALGMTNADTNIVLQLFGRPITVVNLSYSLAKTLSEKLRTLVGEWETKTKHDIQTTDAIDNAFGGLVTKTSPSTKRQ